jgi:hypothetical protein
MYGFKLLSICKPAPEKNRKMPRLAVFSNQMYFCDILSCDTEEYVLMIVGNMKKEFATLLHDCKM